MKGLLLYSNIAEEVETVGGTALLRRAGFEIVTATFEKDKKIKCVYGTELEADYFVSELNLDEFDFLVIPGGNYVVRTYEKEENIKNLVIEFNKKNKLIAAICAGPMFIGHAGLLKDKRYTLFPGCEREEFGGKRQQYHKVVRDGNIITARSVAAVVLFVNEIVKYLKGYELAEEFMRKIYY
ncbi:MAG TPA: DJ-1/PfpI family protein [Acholeplasma sp.]|jgi:4-methyl-5(b-hydroxyethyl)-thiazole monophosphate biosynthesis|nr:DJ-1/PfpI family protein [Acholeplasmatales bacterium]HHV33601.1 DJ-1/PfpI family protein [Acholeplasma sp.]